MISVDTSELKRLERDVKAFTKRGYPIANRFALNTTAREARKTAHTILKRDLTLRNKFTLQSVQFDQAKGTNVNTQSSVVGSTLPYMERLEFGGIKRKKGKEGVAIPTSFSAGQGMRKQPRTKMPKQANQLQAIRLSHKNNPGKTRQQKNIIAIKQAAKKSGANKFVFLDLQRTKGIFLVEQGKPNKRTGKAKVRVKMVYDLTRKSVTIKPHPWLKPTVDAIRLRMPGFWIDALKFQIARQRLFK